MKFLSVLLASFILIVTLVESAEFKLEQTEKISGVIEQRGWMKNKESYCQGGSEYYILKMDNGSEITLNSMRDPVNKEDNNASFEEMQGTLYKMLGKQVAITGRKAQITLRQDEHCTDLNAQCLKGTITCNWFRVTDIKQEKY